MEFQDKELKCADCGQPFVFTAGEQLFFHDRKFINTPKRCKPCKARRDGKFAAKAAQPETRTNCHHCGSPTTVPFKPTQGRPVLCRSCFQNQKKQGGATMGIMPRNS